jgi:hypothetical protein
VTESGDGRGGRGDDDGEALGREVQDISLEGGEGRGVRGGDKSNPLLDLTSFPGLGSAGSTASVQRPPVPSSQSHPHTSHPHKPQSSHSKRHAPSELSLGSFMTTPSPSVAGGTRLHPPVERPQRTNKKTTTELRQAELEQLETRFQGNHRLVEKGKERSVYRVTVAPTDPDWNFKFSTIDLEVTFPRVYPTVPLSITIPNDQGLHPTYIAHSNQAVSRYLATAPAGSGELMFRPFLRWFDKTITSVLKDAAKQVTVELFASSGDETTPTEDHTHSGSEEDEESMESSGEEEEEEEDEQSEEGSDNQEMQPATISTEKRGTEMRLSGLVMSDGVGVGRCASVRLTLQCTRCRAQQDHSLRADKYVCVYIGPLETEIEKIW